MFSIRIRNRLGNLFLATAIVAFVWLLQTNVMTRLTLNGILCNLPLTFTIVWASVFGARLAPLSQDDVRLMPMGEILIYQALCGSLSGAFIGALFGALFASVIPVYPFCYPLIGWIAGYFSLKHVNHGVFLVVPLVLCGSVLAESIMAAQLFLVSRPEIMSHFTQAVLLEALMNTIIAPSIFLPMQRWYWFSASKELAGTQ
jgi:rod shape-determining protein MreD